MPVSVAQTLRSLSEVQERCCIEYKGLLTTECEQAINKKARCLRITHGRAHHHDIAGSDNGCNEVGIRQNLAVVFRQGKYRSFRKSYAEWKGRTFDRSYLHLSGTSPQCRFGSQLQTTRNGYAATNYQDPPPTVFVDTVCRQSDRMGAEPVAVESFE